ncbi:ABC transporter ATP-binding protein [Prauserella endophytica]|uniref:Spermidine/putrescine import ATP-binding protein PotA n=1 Tax=Prauserella endophytica TaxID=1592324 RepID=A0ABY2S701_9PSEU|nr:ABC transporter ATP-binding protein [Prauserella endophytica]TKG71693.1 ABC transporter ATP-binding protein [Prauserella endophytica]
MQDLAQRGASIDLDGVHLSYGDTAVLRDIDLRIKGGEFMTLLGPSGSGKSTLLNLMGGFARANAGEVRVNGAQIDHLPPNRRDMGMVYQNYALFPHMTIADNIAYPLKRRKMSKSDRAALVRAALAMVDLHGFADRRPSQLSGGQQQRVAVARAIVFRPQILLMDEPLGALDKRLRDEMQSELRQLHEEVGSTVVFVTHDQEEAMVMSDRIAVMNGGRVEQVGTPHELYSRPRTTFVATFLGESTMLRGTVHAVGGQSIFHYRDTRVPVDGHDVTGSGTLLLRPEQIELSEDKPLRSTNVLEVRIENVESLGPTRRTKVTLPDGASGIVREPGSKTSRLRPGDTAWMSWQVGASWVVPEAQEECPHE